MLSYCPGCKKKGYKKSLQPLRLTLTPLFLALNPLQAKPLKPPPRPTYGPLQLKGLLLPNCKKEETRDYAIICDEKYIPVQKCKINSIDSWERYQQQKQKAEFPK